MFLIVGLGNPGMEYVSTRHNVGFMCVDALFDKFGSGVFKNKFDGLIAEGNINGEKIYLLKPQTYMNLSRNSVVKAANFYKILPQNKYIVKGLTNSIFLPRSSALQVHRVRRMR